MAPGKLVVVGSGISSISQLTLQAVAHIEQADLVCYMVADPLTEAYIHTKNSNNFNLYVYYDDKKPRSDTYVQMAEYMVQNVRDGKFVVAVLYGHPGVFVSPTHRAIALARNEGFSAVMLPGVSAEDCLFADIGIDPSVVGLLTYEATDLLVRQRALNPSSALILWQVGVVGIVDFNFAGFGNAYLDKLLDYLEPVYGADHPITHYIAAVLPHDATIIEKFTIAELRKPDVRSKVNAISTFYLSPKTKLATDESAVASLGLSNWRPKPMYPDNSFGLSVPYTPHDREVVASMASHVPPSGYKALIASPTLVEILTKLTLDTKLLERYKANPKTFANTPGLTSDEQHALDTGNPQHVYHVMRDHDDPVRWHPPPITAVITALAVAGG